MVIVVRKGNVIIWYNNIQNWCVYKDIYIYIQYELIRYEVNMRNSEAVAYRLLPKGISSDAACAASCKWGTSRLGRSVFTHRGLPNHDASSTSQQTGVSVWSEARSLLWWLNDHQNTTIYIHILPSSQVPTPARLVRLVADNHPLALAEVMEPS